MQVRKVSPSRKFRLSPGLTAKTMLGSHFQVDKRNFQDVGEPRTLMCHQLGCFKNEAHLFL